MEASKRRILASWAGALVLAVALVALALVGCGSDSEDPGTDTTAPPNDGADIPVADLTLTESDNGGAFTVSVGDTIVVTLEGNITTGYEWTTALSAEDATLLTAASEEGVYTPDPVEGDIVGSGGEFTFTFTATAAGQADLRLNYWRPFEAQAEPNQVFLASVTIQ